MIYALQSHSVEQTMAAIRLEDHIAHAVTNRGLKLILNSTEQCNLRCKYCYETFELHQMRADVVQGILNLVEKRASIGLDWLEVEFFGGEPLAAWKVVRDLSKGLHEICSRNKVRLLGGMTTNLTLLDRSRLDVLAERGFTFFQVTLDGPKAIHDVRRVTRRAKGTFDGIWQNLLILKASKYALEVMLRIHFDRSTISSLSDDLTFFRELASALLIGDERFCIHFDPLEPWGRAAGAEVEFFSSQSEEEKALHLLLASALKAGISLRQLPQANATIRTGESGCVVCYAARANSFVIRPDGRVAKCTVAFESDKNVVGRLLPTGELEIDQERHLPWLRGLISGDAKSLTCPAIGLV